MFRLRLPRQYFCLSRFFNRLYLERFPILLSHYNSPPKLILIMKALLLREYNHLEIADVAQPQPATGEVLIRIKACGVCGSDVHGYDGGSGRRIPPLVMGHEAAGIVAQVGTGVADLHPGDRVTFDSTISCGECFYCRRAQVNLCEERQVLGVSCGEYRRAGAFAEYVVVPRRIVYTLPDSLSFEHAATIEAVSVAVHAVALTPIALNDTALVMGAGMIGLLALQVARLAGCRRIISVDTDETRLQIARQLGATDVLNAQSENVIERVRALTLGRGADVAFECVGAQGTVESAIEGTHKGGAVTLVGNIAQRVEIPLQSVVTRQIRLQGSCASSGEIAACIDLLASGAIQVQPMLSVVAPLEDGPLLFQRLHDREPNLMKVVLTP